MIEDLIDRHCSEPDQPELCHDCHTPVATCDCEKPSAAPDVLITAALSLSYRLLKELEPNPIAQTKDLRRSFRVASERNYGYGPHRLTIGQWINLRQCLRLLARIPIGEEYANAVEERAGCNW